MNLGTIFSEKEYSQGYEFANSNGYTIKEVESKQEWQEKEIEIINREGETEIKKEKELVWVRYFQIVEIPIYKPTEEEQKEKIKNLCSSYIEGISWRVERYNTQKELGIETSDTAETYIKILEYMQYLRDYDNSGEWWLEEPKTFEEYINANLA